MNRDQISKASILSARHPHHHLLSLHRTVPAPERFNIIRRQLSGRIILEDPLESDPYLDMDLDPESDSDSVPSSYPLSLSCYFSTLLSCLFPAVVNVKIETRVVSIAKMIVRSKIEI